MSSIRKAGYVAVLAMAAVAAFASAPAMAQDRAPEVDAEHMFGFSEGTDIGVPFQPEGELETIGRVGRQSGAYGAFTTTANLKYPLSPQWRIAPGIAFSSVNISGVPDLPDTSQFSFDHASFEIRWHPLEREGHPFGLTFVLTPYYGTIEPASGRAADNYGAQFIAALDRTLVPERAFAAVNVAYTLGRTRPWSDGLAADSSLLVPSAAASVRLLPWLFVGAELRYLQGYSGLAMQGLTDQALYAGPAFFMTFGRGVSLSGAFEPQLWGQATGAASGLDLVQFDRQQFKLRLAVDL